MDVQSEKKLAFAENQGAGSRNYCAYLRYYFHYAPQYCLQRGVYNFMDYIGAHLQYADKFIVNAAATTAELQKLADRMQVALPECKVVPLGANFGKGKPVAEEEVSEELRKVVQDGPYILMVGTVEPRKNHKLLLEAYNQGLKQMGYNIVFAGYLGWNMEAFAEKLHAHPDFGKGVFHLEGLNDKAIGYLYQHAEFLAFCSYTEGFGLPLIEGICRGTPVIACRYSCFARGGRGVLSVV